MGDFCSTCSNAESASHNGRQNRNTDTTKKSRYSSLHHIDSEDYVSSEDNGMITDEDPQFQSQSSSSPEKINSTSNSNMHKAAIEEEIITEFQQYIQDGNITMVMLLNDENASMNLTNTQFTNGDNCLLTSVKNQRYDITEYLLKSQLSPNYRNGQTGNTALHYAADLGDIKTMQLLHKYGGDGTIKNNENETAITIADGLGHNRIVKLLGGTPVQSRRKLNNNVTLKVTELGYRGTTQRVKSIADDILSFSPGVDMDNEDMLSSMNTKRLNNIAEDIYNDIETEIKDDKKNLRNLSDWMEKKQSSPPYSWLKRWIVIHGKDGYLLWSDRQITVGKKGVDKREKRRWNKCIAIGDIKSVTAVKEGKTQRKFKINVDGRGTKREFIWKAKSKEVRDEWVQEMNHQLNTLRKDKMYNSGRNIL